MYNITSDDIQSIFKTYPEVKNKFISNVPAKLTEKGNNHIEKILSDFILTLYLNYLRILDEIFSKLLFLVLFK